MPTITAILHTHNDALRIARAIESLRPCDEVLVIDHGSTDGTCEAAVRFGARVMRVRNEACDTQRFLAEARHDWILCLHPTESLQEGLEASLFEWKLGSHTAQTAFGVLLFEERPEGWTPPRVETRLVHRTAAEWNGWKPLTKAGPVVLDGSLSRMRLP